ncbi:MAG: hypothetical protein WBF77_05700 [Sulfurimonadaceae bacterium]
MKKRVLTLILVLVPFYMSGCVVKVVPKNEDVYRERNIVHHYPEYKHVVTKEKHYGHRDQHTTHVKQNNHKKHAKREKQQPHTKRIKNVHNVKIKQYVKNEKSEKRNQNNKSKKEIKQGHHERLAVRNR